MRTIAIYQDRGTEHTRQYFVAVGDASLGVPVCYVFKVDLNAPDTGRLHHEQRTIRLMWLRIRDELRLSVMSQPTMFCVLPDEELNWIRESVDQQIKILYLSGLKMIRDEENRKNESLTQQLP